MSDDSEYRINYALMMEQLPATFEAFNLIMGAKYDNEIMNIFIVEKETRKWNSKFIYSIIESSGKLNDEIRNELFPYMFGKEL